MKAPEKIYYTPTEGGFYLTTTKPEPPFAEGVEYTCTDVFIEKACEWLKNNVEKYYYLDEAYDKVISTKNLNNDFENYMKGE